MERKELTSKELHKAMRNIAILESQVQESNRRREESAEELKLIQASIATLKIERQTVQRQRFEAANWLDNWKVRRQAGDVSSRLMEFSSLDLETATCDFSESFKIGCESYSCSFYKGEMSNRTVMIKKLHLSNMQAQSEFQQEVNQSLSLSLCYLFLTHKHTLAEC